jgi:hypothetical protein
MLRLASIARHPSMHACIDAKYQGFNKGLKTHSARIMDDGVVYWKTGCCDSVERLQNATT